MAVQKPQRARVPFRVQLPKMHPRRSELPTPAWLPWLFSLTLFASAGLLFLVQPMVAKMILPLLGGSPTVWSTCMVFFQAVLLLGYLYAHLSTRYLPVRRQILVHAALLCLPLLTLPIAVPRDWVPPADANPIHWLLALLCLAVGLPFAVVSTTAPLVQKWFSATGAPGGRDPYFLYAASNAGSMAGLLGYPFVVEPSLRLLEQSQWWAFGYGSLVVLLCMCAWQVWRRTGGETRPELANTDKPTEAAAPGWKSYLHWIVLAAVPSSLMLGVTTHLSTDIAAVPLLWVVPLGLYLLTFILAFGRCPRSLDRVCFFGMAPMLLVLIFMSVSGIKPGLTSLMAVHLVAYFMIAMVCHGDLARRRPAPAHLTGFFLCVSLGGVLGGLFNALLAPLAFKTVAEYALVLCAAYLVWPAERLGVVGRWGRWFHRLAPLSLVAAAVVATITLQQMLEFDLFRYARTLFALTLRMVHESLNVHGFVEATGLNGMYAVYALGSVLLLAAAAYVLRRKLEWKSRALDIALPALLAVFTTVFIFIWRTDYWGLTWLELALPGDVPLARCVAFGVPALSALTLWRRPVRFALGLSALLAASMVYACLYGDVLVRDRSFFGTLSVERVGPWQRLYHGTTLHGQQSLHPDERREPLTYYHRTGPIGQVFDSYVSAVQQPPIAVIGLGTGTLAAYAEAGQKLTFYEIDPAVLELARMPACFTFLQDAEARGAHIDVELGDARIQLAKAPSKAYGLIVVDAFSSDSIPLHLITRQALHLYLSKLDDGGLLAFHVSNRYLELQPVLTALAADARLYALHQGDEGNDAIGKAGSNWVVLARRPRDFNALASKYEALWEPLPRRIDFPVWTDDFTNLWSVFRW